MSSTPALVVTQSALTIFAFRFNQDGRFGLRLSRGRQNDMRAQKEDCYAQRIVRPGYAGADIFARLFASHVEAILPVEEETIESLAAYLDIQGSPGQLGIEPHFRNCCLLIDSERDQAIGPVRLGTCRSFFQS